MVFSIADRICAAKETVEKLKKGTRPDEEIRRQLREKASQYDSEGQPWTQREFIHGNFPQNYQHINGMCQADVSRLYGSEITNLLFKHKEPTLEQLDTAVYLQMERDRIVCKELLYDPFTKENIPYGAFQQKYGEVITSDAYDDPKHDYLTMVEMREKHNRRQPIKFRKNPPIQNSNLRTIKKEKPIQAKPLQPRIKKNNLFKINRNIISNSKYRMIFRNKGYSTIYEYMWINLVNDKWINKPGYSVKEKYYDEGLLVYCSSYRFLAKECGLDKNYTKKVLLEFEKNGIVKLEKISPEKKKISLVVVVLGEWEEVNGAVTERLYRDQIFMNK